MSEVFLKRIEVEKLVGFKRQKLYEMIEAGEFPAAVILGSNTHRWILSEVEAWQAEQIAKAPRRRTYTGDPQKRATRYAPRKQAEMSLAEIVE